LRLRPPYPPGLRPPYAPPISSPLVTEPVLYPDTPSSDGDPLSDDGEVEASKSIGNEIESVKDSGLVSDGLTGRGLPPTPPGITGEYNTGFLQIIEVLRSRAQSAQPPPGDDLLEPTEAAPPTHDVDQHHSSEGRSPTPADVNGPREGTLSPSEQEPRMKVPLLHAEPVSESNSESDSEADGQPASEPVRRRPIVLGSGFSQPDPGITFARPLQRPPPPPQVGGYPQDQTGPLTKWEVNAIVEAEMKRHLPTGSSNKSLRDGIDDAIKQANVAKTKWLEAHPNDPELAERIQSKIERAGDLKEHGLGVDEPTFDERCNEWLRPDQLRVISDIKAKDKPGVARDAPYVPHAPAAIEAPKDDGPSTAAKFGTAGAFGLATIVLASLGGIWLYKRIKERMDARKKSTTGNIAGKQSVKRRHERDWVPSSD
jgi:hypothetical protein